MNEFFLHQALAKNSVHTARLIFIWRFLLAATLVNTGLLCYLAYHVYHSR